MTHRYLLIIPILILLGLIMTAGSWGLADINVKSAQRSPMLWETDVNKRNETDWIIANDSVSKALDQDPLNPELLILMANVQEWKIYLDNGNVENNRILTSALNNYHEAAKLRPAWPFTWGHISLVKYRMGKFDQEFQQAVENAINTGPWEPGVQQILAEIGLSAWKELDLDMRAKMVRNIHRGMTMQPIQMLNILKKYGQLSIACYQKNKHPVVKEICEKQNDGKKGV